MSTIRQLLCNGGRQIPGCCLSVLTGKGKRVSTVKLLFQVRLEQKRFDSNLKVITEEFIHCFISAWARAITPVYSNLALHPCTLLANFKGFLWKTPFLFLPNHLHNKLPYKSLPAHDATLHWLSSQTELRWMIEVELPWISSAHLRDQSGWRQAVSKTAPEVKLCLGLTLVFAWRNTPLPRTVCSAE